MDDNCGVNRRPQLIAVSVTEPKRHPLFPIHAAYEVEFTGKTLLQDASVKFETGPISDDRVEKLHIFHKHGFTVVEIPEEWLYRYRHDIAGWQNFVAQSAVNQVAALYPDGIEGRNLQTDFTYDKELADRVLKYVYSRVPDSVSHTDLKYELKPENSDSELLKVLSALKLRGEIDGIEHRESSSGQRSLDAMQKIRITAKGVDKVEGNKDAVPPVHHITFAGPQGRVNINSTDNSSNIINVNISSEIDKLVELSQGQPELETAAREIRQAHPDKALTLEKVGKWVSLASAGGSLMLKAWPHLENLYRWAEASL